MEKEELYSFIVLLIFIGITVLGVVFFSRDTGEGYTSVFFTELPYRTEDGMDYRFAFGVTNFENEGRLYDYNIFLDLYDEKGSLSSRTLVYSANFGLGRNETKTFSYNLAAVGNFSKGKVIIEVNGGSNGTSEIFFEFVKS